MLAIDTGKHIGRNKIVTGIDSEEEGRDRPGRGCSIDCSNCSNGRLVGYSLRCFSMSWAGKRGGGD